MKAEDKYANQAIIKFIIDRTLKKKKEIQFFKGYKPNYYFQVNSIKSGDINDY